MLKKIILVLGLGVGLSLAGQVLVVPVEAVAKKAVQPAETTLEVKAKLDSFAKEHVVRANANLKATRNNVSITQDKQTKQFLASFREVDFNTLTTEIYPGTAKGALYVGHVVYLEKVYECLGDSRDVALAGPYKITKARRIREITRYDQGKWFY